MKPEELSRQIIDYCKANANPANVAKYSRFFKGEFNSWGLSQPQMQDLTTQLLNNTDIDLPLVLKTMPLLMKSGKYEETSFGLLLINRMRKQYFPKLLDEISAWFPAGISNWAHADILAMWILPALIENGHVTENSFIPWLKSPFSFQRRCVPVTYIKSLKAQNSPEKLFSNIEPLMSDPVREVQQGTGWFLREAWKLYPEATEQFLLKWKDTAPRLIYQYACEKMDKTYRLKFRKSK